MTDTQMSVNETQAGNKTDGSEEDMPSTIYPPPTTIREEFGFTAEKASTGSPFLQVKASPPTTAAMTGSASYRPMIIVGSIMLAGCVGGGVYLWYLRKMKMDAEQADSGDGHPTSLQDDQPAAATAAPGLDDDEDAVPEP